jgi:photosystem II stability/assembly factor-like uncharacterized protein
MRLRCRLLPVLAFLLTAPAILPAQEYLDTLGRWKTLNRAVWSGRISDFEQPAVLFFRDPMHGFVRIRLNQATPRWYRTSDGGRTWDSTSDTIPVPHRMLDAAFGYGPLGAVSSDGGATWRRLTADSGLPVVALAAYDRRRMAALYEYPYTNRLAVTTDGGATWTRLDSVALRNGQPELVAGTPFGRLPGDPPSTSYDWWSVPTWIDSDRFVAILDASGRTYVVTVDVTARTLDAAALPVRQSPGVVGSIVYYFTRTLDTNRRAVPAFLHVSRDRGHTWDSVATPPWLDESTFAMFSATDAAASNVRTTDGGRTWEPVIHSYYDSNPDPSSFVLVRAIDVDHFVVAGPYSLFASSSDGGRTWTQNVAGGLPTAMAAHRGRVVVGRDYGSIVVSADSGETWRDLGATREVPRALERVWALAWPDSLREPDRVIGVAGFLEPDRSYHVHVIESDDAGASWHRGDRLPTLETFLGGIDSAGGRTLDRKYNAGYVSWNVMTLQFVRTPGDERTTGFIAIQGSLLRSSDAGRTWSQTCDSILFARLVMSDTSRGVAASVFSVAKPGALYSTSDGGRSWTWRRTLISPAHFVYGLGETAPGRYQVLAPNMNRLTQLYVFGSSDYGVTWSQSLMLRSGSDADGRLLWLDTTDLHVFAGGGLIRHSTDGGETFHLIHQEQSTFGPIVTSFDGQYVYEVSAGNQFGRWRIARRGRAVAPASVPPDERLAAALSVAPVPARDVVHVRITTPADETHDRPIRLRIVDLLGRVVTAPPPFAPATGACEVSLDVGGLSPGSYLLEAVVGDERHVTPIVIGGAR